MISNNFIILGSILTILLFFILFILFKKGEGYVPIPSKEEMKKRRRDMLKKRSEDLKRKKDTIKMKEIQKIEKERPIIQSADPLAYIMGKYLDPESALAFISASPRIREMIGSKMPIQRINKIYTEEKFIEFLEKLDQEEIQDKLLPNQRESVIINNIYPIHTYPQALQNVYNERVNKIEFTNLNRPFYEIDNQGRLINLLPVSIHEINFGPFFNQPLDLEYIPKLKKLYLGSKFNNVINVPPDHPLEEIIFSQNSIFNGDIPLPINIKNLVLPFNYSGILDFTNFVDNLVPLFIPELTLGKNPIRLPPSLKIGKLNLITFPDDENSIEGQNFINFVNSLNTDKIEIAGTLENLPKMIPSLHYHIDRINNILRPGPDPEMTEEEKIFLSNFERRFRR